MSNALQFPLRVHFEGSEKACAWIGCNPKGEHVFQYGGSFFKLDRLHTQVGVVSNALLLLCVGNHVHIPWPVAVEYSVEHHQLQPPATMLHECVTLDNPCAALYESAPTFYNRTRRSIKRCCSSRPSPQPKSVLVK